jgi:cytoskeletal protein RodZ
MSTTRVFHQAISYIRSYRIILIWLLILGLLGFTLWQSLSISNPEANQTYLEQQRSKQEESTTNIQLDQQLRSRINNLERNPVDVEPENLGTEDPFNP